MPARALFHTAPRCVRIREMPTPRPGVGEVVVTTLFSGISGGTERLIYRGEFPEGLALDDTIDALGGSFRYPFLTAMPASAKSRTGTGRYSPFSRIRMYSQRGPTT